MTIVSFLLYHRFFWNWQFEWVRRLCVNFRSWLFLDNSIYYIVFMASLCCIISAWWLIEIFWWLRSQRFFFSFSYECVVVGAFKFLPFFISIYMNVYLKICFCCSGSQVIFVFWCENEALFCLWPIRICAVSLCFLDVPSVLCVSDCYNLFVYASFSPIEFLAIEVSMMPVCFVGLLFVTIVDEFD